MGGPRVRTVKATATCVAGLDATSQADKILFIKRPLNPSSFPPHRLPNRYNYPIPEPYPQNLLMQELFLVLRQTSGRNGTGRRQAYLAR